MVDELGCTGWRAGTTCADFCSGGACDTCGTSCTPGAARCNANTVEMCRQDANGCTDWSANGACLPGQHCSAGACLNCGASCTVGQKQCAATGILECRQQPNGCNDWFSAGNCAVGESCQDGKCVPPCKDECSQAAARCDATGVPLKCQKAVTGCYVWKSAAACTAGSKCHEGVCREGCSSDEIETCPDGFVCTGTADGKLCLPADAPDGGVGPGTLPGIDDPTEDPGTTPINGNDGQVAATGCGCAAAPAPLALAMAPLLLALLRRRRR